MSEIDEARDNLKQAADRYLRIRAGKERSQDIYEVTVDESKGRAGIIEAANKVKRSMLDDERALADYAAELLAPHAVERQPTNPDLLAAAEKVLATIDGGGGYDGGFDITPATEAELRAAIQEEREFPTSKRIAELERLLLESQNHNGNLCVLIGNIEQCRAVEGDSITILCDNPDANSIETQGAVEVCGDYTGYKPERYFGKNWEEALAKAARVSRRHYSGDEVYE